MTDLLDAIFRCDLRKLKIFIGDGQNVNCEIPETDGCTILHIAAGIKKKAKKDEIISFLLDMGADPNSRSDDDLTPVHIAAMWNNSFELEKLLQKGGNPWLLDNEEKNAFDLAANNYSYEAYQLLNQYLADNKFNFKINKDLPSKMKSMHITFADNPSVNNSNCQFNSVLSSFYSANENFPMNFSSSEEESKSFLRDVSKIINKNRSKMCQSNNNIKTDSDFSDHSKSNSWLYINGRQNSHPSVFEENTCSENNVTNDLKTCSENSVTNNLKTCSETILELDEPNGIVLVELSNFSDPFSLSNQKCPNYTSLTVNDWKSYRSDIEATSSDCSSFSNSEIIVPKKYFKLNNSEIYKELINLGDKPGPVSDFTREVYLKRLTRLKSGCNISCLLPEPKFYPEIYQFLSQELNMNKIQEYVNIMMEEFNNSKSEEVWREGNKKCCFNYFLLDPRVTQNLPARQVGLSFEQKFQIFIDAIFYVGKGTKARPYSHLINAAKAMLDTNKQSEKINHILEIWNSGYGVISLHCFHNCIPVEAYTQEACVIEAIGLKNLTNLRVGNYYGTVAKWARSRKRQVGISLLNRSLQIFLHEGEKQIKPKDLKKSEF